jgi:hypothetical protein
MYAMHARATFRMCATNLTSFARTQLQHLFSDFDCDLLHPCLAEDIRDAPDADNDREKSERSEGDGSPPAGDSNKDCT